jgi:hypothetical protein
VAGWVAAVAVAEWLFAPRFGQVNTHCRSTPFTRKVRGNLQPNTFHYVGITGGVKLVFVVICVTTAAPRCPVPTPNPRAKNESTIGYGPLPGIWRSPWYAGLTCSRNPTGLISAFGPPVANTTTYPAGRKFA